MTDAIDIRSVSRNYGKTQALDDVTFTVPEGSICGLLGRNGAGKTTIMSMIAGQDRPSTGELQVLGHRPFEHAPTLSQISYVRDNQRYPDDYRLHHVLRIAPAFAPNWSEDLASELVASLRIPTKGPIKKFSRGQLSSVAIVLGLASRAPITLLDEPYLGLDVTARAVFHRVLLRDYELHPRTVVLSTHLIEESESLLDRVVIMERGRVTVESDSDTMRELASVVSGTTEAVGQITGNRTVLQTNAVGGLASVTVSGPIDEELRADAARLGLRVAPASLQELVSAHGAGETDPTTTREEARA